jgi:CRISPR/Cas system-associated exonuclease Cas4 (RecB family)
MWRRSVLLLFVGITSTACAAASSSARPVRNAGRDVITAAEIVTSRVTDAYQAVSQLRPEFLRRRSATAVPTFAPVSVVVYVDGTEFGYAESLRYVPLERVRTIRYISQVDADLRWGGGKHPAGAILVTTQK